MIGELMDDYREIHLLKFPYLHHLISVCVTSHSTQGTVWVNDFCLGRYWPEVGPQVTLYVPAATLRQGDNTLLLLELERAPCDHPDSCFVTLQIHHQINGPTPP